jgi:hypothetical protein
MKPRPIYRWKSFWLGVVVVAFMGWASWKGRGADHFLTMAGDRWGLQLVKRQGVTVFVWGPPVYLVSRDDSKQFSTPPPLWIRG